MDKRIQITYVESEPRSSESKSEALPQSEIIEGKWKGWKDIIYADVYSTVKLQ